MLGNHDACMVAAAFEIKGEHAGPDCFYIFKYNGGDLEEAKKITENDQIFNWLKLRPLIYKIDNLLFQHSDTANYYFSLGKTIEEINNKGFEMMKTASGAFQIFFEMTNSRYWDELSFSSYKEKEQHINNYMNKFDIDTIIHGHTRFVGNKPSVYFNKKIINVDGSLSNGYRKDSDRGFLIEFIKNEKNYFNLV